MKLASIRRLSVVASLLIMLGSAACSATGSTTSTSPTGDFDFYAAEFPATYQETVDDLGPYQGFEADINNTIEYKCMVSKGYSTPAELPSLAPITVNVDNLYDQFPDVSLYKSGSFDLTPPIHSSTPGAATTPNIPASILPAWRQDSDLCESEAAVPFATTTAELDPIMKIWSTETGQSLMTNPVVEGAMNKWKVCVANGGYPAQSIEDYYRIYVVQDVEMHLSVSEYSTVNQNPQIIALAKLFGSCVGPVANAMDAVRLQDRQELVGKYATQLDNIATQINQLVGKLSAQYGVKFAGSHG